MNSDSRFSIDFGASEISCIYDSATFLAMLLDSVVLDNTSTFYQILCALRNAAFERLPDTVIISFPVEN